MSAEQVEKSREKSREDIFSVMRFLLVAVVLVFVLENVRVSQGVVSSEGRFCYSFVYKT